MVRLRPLPGRLASLLLVAGAAAAPVPLTGQVDASPPAEVADEFQRGFQSMAWAGLVQRMHPEALARVRLAIDIVIDADETGWALRSLGGGVEDRAAWDAVDDAAAFVGVVRFLQENAPGLLSSLVSRRSRVLGVVEEDGETAHAVYRLERLIAGAEPEVLVMTLRRTASGWKVSDAPEIGTLYTAIRGIPIPR